MIVKDLRFDDPDAADRADLADRVVAGEVYVFREALQSFGLFDMWQRAALRGVARSVGRDVADRCAVDGFHRVHEWVAAADIPAMTDAVYEEIEPTAPDFLNRFMQGAFPGIRNFYYERTPNVRFHIPYDIAQAHRAAFDEFAKDHGQGKIAAHGPHRDSWLDCPSNGINLWFAMGRIRPGNGLTIYPLDYAGAYRFQPSGDIADGQKLNKTLTFDLHPGDVVMFHTDHVHGSELNRTTETRFAVSCRLSVQKPHFPNLHFHRYVNANWQNNAVLRPAAELPAMLQPSYVTSLVTRVRQKLLPQERGDNALPAEAIGTRNGDRVEVPLAEVAVGAVRGVTPALCVARLSETEVVALTRRCPHAGGDLANGWVDGRAVVCPWHNLPFDPETGRSPCASLPKLRRVACRIEGERIVVMPGEVINHADDSPAAAALADAATRDAAAAPAQ